MFTDHLFISKLRHKVPVIDFDTCLISLMFHFTNSYIVLCAYIKKVKSKSQLKYILALTKIDISSTYKIDIEKSYFCFFISGEILSIFYHW